MALTPDESKELQRLLAKAKSMAMPPPIEVDHSEFGVYDPNTGLFVNPVTGDVDNVWDSEFSPTAGAMTDGSKCREDESNHPPAKKPVAAKSQAAPYMEVLRVGPRCHMCLRASHQEFHFLIQRHHTPPARSSFLSCQPTFQMLRPGAAL